MKICKYCNKELPINNRRLKDQCTKCYDKLRRRGNPRAIKQQKEANARFKKRHPHYWLLPKQKEYKVQRGIIIKVIASTNNRFKRADKCEICGSRKTLHFHHWRYRLPVQKTDFSTLCKECHMIQHFKPLKAMLTSCQKESN